LIKSNNLLTVFVFFKEDEGEKMVKLTEVKINIATAIAAAFGFVIALIWKEIIVGLFALAGLTINDIENATGAAIAVVAGIIITIVCVIGIMYISKWGGIVKK
jgi:hypothetical protein